MAAPARSEYDLRVRSIRSRRQTVRSWVVAAVGYFLGDTHLLLPRVRVAIVTAATGEVLSEWKLRANGADDLVAKIRRDLDVKDAGAFAGEWGLRSS